MNATRTVAKRKLEKNPLRLSLKFSGCFWQGLSVKNDSMFLCCEPIVRTQCFFDLKNKANLKSVHSKDYKKWGYNNYSSETTPMK